MFIGQAKPFIVGDFNFHMNVTSDNDAARFLAVSESFDLHQYVSCTTHRNGNTLDLFLSRNEDSLV